MMYEGVDTAADTDAVQQQQAPRSTRVELEPIGLTAEGQRYRVTYAGETLVEGVRNPIFDACELCLLEALPAGSRSGARASQAPPCNSISRRAPVP